MFETTRVQAFRETIATLSPIDLVEGVADSVRVLMLVGSADDVTPPALSQAYRHRAVELGKRVDLRVLDGEGHEILLRPAVLDALADLLT